MVDATPQNGTTPAHRGELLSALRQEMEARRERCLSRVIAILNEETCTLGASIGLVHLGGGVFGLKPVPDVVALPIEEKR